MFPGSLAVSVRLLAALLVLPLLVGGAHAQGPLGGGVVKSTVTAALEDPGRALQPGTLSPITVLVIYSGDAGSQPAPDSDINNENGTQPTKITLTAKNLPAWITGASFVPAELNISPGAAATAADGFRETAHVTMFLNVSDQAPALERVNITVAVSAAPNGNIAGSTGESPTLPVRAAVVAKVNVTAEAVAQHTGAVVVPGGRWTSIPFIVRNEGNSNVTVRLNVTARPQNSQYEAPATVDLARGETKTVDVRLRLPWTTGQGGTLELDGTPITENDDGKTSTGDVDIAGQSALPAPPLGALVVALASLALWRRR